MIAKVRKPPRRVTAPGREGVGPDAFESEGVRGEMSKKARRL